MLNKRRSSSWPLAQLGGRTPYVVLVIGKCHQLGPETDSWGGLSEEFHVWTLNNCI